MLHGHSRDEFVWQCRSIVVLVPVEPFRPGGSSQMSGARSLSDATPADWRLAWPDRQWSTRCPVQQYPSRRDPAPLESVSPHAGPVTTPPCLGLQHESREGGLGPAIALVGWPDRVAEGSALPCPHANS